MKNRAVVRLGMPMLIAVSGCSAGMTHSSEVAPIDMVSTGPTYNGSSANRVVRAELAPLRETSLDAALRRLRPEWLRVSPSNRQGTEPARASVYIDNAYAGELETLLLIPASAVIDVSYLGPSAALDRFGSGCRCPGGVILVLIRNIK
jgi:hypothetical protein